MIRPLRLLVVALLLAAASAVPADATGATTLRGTAGSWVAVTVRHDVRLAYPFRELTALTADRGQFVGFALVGAGGSLTYLNGRHDTRLCAFGPRCQVDDWPSVSSDAWTQDGAVLVRAGNYRLALLGHPGARVSLRTTLPFLHGVSSTTHRGRLQLRSLASSTPALDGLQPHADGAAAFPGEGVVVIGLVWRLDAQYVHGADVDSCFGSGGQQLPYQVGCQSDGTVYLSSAHVGYTQCSLPGVSLLCLPLTDQPVSITHGASAVLRGEAHTSYEMRVKAARSQVFAWAFALRF